MQHQSGTSHAMPAAFPHPAAGISLDDCCLAERLCPFCDLCKDEMSLTESDLSVSVNYS